VTVTGDPTAGIGIVAAMTAGAISFLSPCVLPLVPGYLSAVSGVAPDELDRAPVRRVLLPSLLFVASFSVIFVLLGVTATAVGSTLRDHRETLERLAGFVIIALGVLFVVSAFAPRLNRDWRIDALTDRARRGGPVIAGVAFAIAWTPCVGPTLGAILSAAAITESAARGAFLLVAYSAGLALPFLLTALAFSQMTSAFAVVKRHYAVLIGFGGAVLIGMGLLIVTGQIIELNIEAQRLLDRFGIAIFDNA
jgi:cytochrome c-type biogenesis protein